LLECKRLNRRRNRASQATVEDTVPYGDGPANEGWAAMERLVTIGYEGATMADFIATLRHADVATLVDVREAPISRRREFAKRQLASAVRDAGIGYRHEMVLGAPKRLRQRVKADGEYDPFFRDYAEHLAFHEDAVAALASGLSGGVALMCYERDYRICHRRLVAEALARHTGLQPQHL